MLELANGRLDNGWYYLHKYCHMLGCIAERTDNEPEREKKINRFGKGYRGVSHQPARPPAKRTSQTGSSGTISGAPGLMESRQLP